VPLPAHPLAHPEPQLGLLPLLRLALALAEAAYAGAAAAAHRQLAHSAASGAPVAPAAAAAAESLAGALDLCASTLDGALQRLRDAGRALTTAASGVAGEAEAAALCLAYLPDAPVEVARCLLGTCAQLKRAPEWHAAEGAWLGDAGLRAAFARDAWARLAAAALRPPGSDDGAGGETRACLQRLPAVVEALQAVAARLRAAVGVG
jgi:hypothetical protein